MSIKKCCYCDSSNIINPNSSVYTYFCKECNKNSESEEIYKIREMRFLKKKNAVTDSFIDEKVFYSNCQNENCALDIQEEKCSRCNVSFSDLMYRKIYILKDDDKNLYCSKCVPMFGYSIVFKKLYIVKKKNIKRD